MGNAVRIYVGDGVYLEMDVEFGSTTLITSNGARDTNTIVLEREVWSALIEIRTREMEKRSR